MARITITPEQVRQVAAQFRQSSQQSEQLVLGLQSQVGAMQPQWEGMSAARFFQEFETWQAQMRHFVRLLDDVARELDAHATRFEELDRVGAASG